MPIVGHDPAVIGIQIAGRGPRKNDRVTHEEERGAGIFAQRIEGHSSVGGAGTSARDRRGNELRAGELLYAGGDGERVEMLKIFFVAKGRIAHGAGEDVESAGFRIDHWSGSDADFGLNKGAFDVARRHGGNVALFVQKTHMPQRRIVRAIGVEGVDAIVLGGDVEHVVGALAGDIDGWEK